MRGRSALGLLVIPVVLAGGCGGGEDDLLIEATPAGMVSASQATLDAETATMEFSVTIDPSGLGLPVPAGPLELTGGGNIDFVNQRSSLTFDLSGLLDAVGEDGPMAGLLAEPMRAVQDGTTSYLCLPLLESFAGAECVRTDLAEQAGGDAAGGFFSGGAVDPQALLESLGGADQVEDLGQEEVVGVTTQHYAGTFTLARAIEGLDAEDAARLQEAFTELGVDEDLADVEHHFDVWVDTDGRIRQVRQELDLDAASGADVAPLVAEFRYLDFGGPVEIEIPADAVDVSELGGFFGGD